MGSAIQGKSINNVTRVLGPMITAGVFTTSLLKLIQIGHVIRYSGATYKRSVNTNPGNSST